MKIKLLKKVRKEITLSRIGKGSNTKYEVNNYYFASPYMWPMAFDDLDLATQSRRYLILERARKLFEHKRTIKL